jgi:hypothetical protein
VSVDTANLAAARTWVTATSSRWRSKYSRDKKNVDSDAASDSKAATAVPMKTVLLRSVKVIIYGMSLNPTPRTVSNFSFNPWDSSFWRSR